MTTSLSTFKKRKTLHITEASDLHLFHHNTPTWFIVDNLNATITSEQVLRQTDLLIFAGDIFDTLQTLPNSSVAIVDAWIGQLLLNCKKFGTKLRILEGTPSHDRKQSQRFDTINQLIMSSSADSVGADVKYYNVLDIEHIADFDLTVLYIPDEWHHDTALTLKEVDQKLAEFNIDRVDIAVMHGYFEYQVPKGVKNIPAHSSQEYHKRVKSMIFCGHVHEASRFGQILVAGSFDCISHGSETKKGYYDCTLYPDNSFDVTFRQNKKAKKYVTVRCNSPEVATSMLVIEQKIRHLPEDSFVRISAPGNNPILKELDIVRKTWPHLNWSTHNSDVSSTESVKVISQEMPVGFKPMALHQQNIMQAMIEQIKTKCQDSDVLSRCEELIAETIRN